VFFATSCFVLQDACSPLLFYSHQEGKIEKPPIASAVSFRRSVNPFKRNLAAVLSYSVHPDASWNVNNRLFKKGHIDLIQSILPDLIAFQEVSSGFYRSLTDSGLFAWSVSSLSLRPTGIDEGRSRALGCAIFGGSSRKSRARFKRTTGQRTRASQQHQRERLAKAERQ
jgi:hypothetical protein